jgi:preprotein translocase subunit SecD
MKITAEFNSNEELVSFISTFGANKITSNTEIPEVKKTVTAKKSKKEVEPDKSMVSDVLKESDADYTPKVDAEVVKEDPKQEGTIVDAEPKEEPKITKEMVRAIFTKVITAGKQKEAKDLTSKYGASKLPDVKEEDYAAIYKEAEELL